MTTTRWLVAVPLLLSGIASAQIRAREVQTYQCVYNSDCNEPLVCGPGGFCRVQCKDDRDCSNGWVCAQPTYYASGVRVPDTAAQPPVYVGGGARGPDTAVAQPPAHGNTSTDPKVSDLQFRLAAEKERARCVPPGTSNDVDILQTFPDGTRQVKFRRISAPACSCSQQPQQRYAEPPRSESRPCPPGGPKQAQAATGNGQLAVPVNPAPPQPCVETPDAQVVPPAPGGSSSAPREPAAILHPR